MLSEEQLHTESLGHLGLVMSTIKKIGLMDMIDQRLPLSPDKGVNISMGKRVAAMILNGLGFMDDRLYMFPEFLKSVPVQRFFGPDVTADHFNDDALGRCLDAIYACGPTKLFSEVAFAIGVKQGLLGKTARFDTTSLVVYGDYDEESPSEDSAPESDGEETDKDSTAPDPEASAEPVSQLQPFSPKHGYSKDGRPDLKQVVLNLATTGKASLPIWMESLSGNASDKVVLQKAAERMHLFSKALKEAPSFLYVGDSAMYDACVANAGEMLWLSRVPHTNKAVKEMMSMKDEDFTWQQLDKGYRIASAHRTYKNTEQRWLLVFSEQKQGSETATLKRRIDQEKEEMDKALWHLSNQVFECPEDAAKAIKPIEKKLKYHTVAQTVQEVRKHKGKGRPKEDVLAEVVGYQVLGSLIADEHKITELERTLGRFVLATNQLDQTALSDAEMLSEYKDQLHTEQGFRFIKNDTFEVSGVFLKKPERIQALMMVMTLCLMIYNLAQYFLRQALVDQNETLPDQLKKPTQKPTMERVGKMFRNVNVVYLRFETYSQELVSNLNDLLRRIIRYFGPVAEKIYGLSG
jgi:transposase